MKYREITIRNWIIKMLFEPSPYNTKQYSPISNNTKQSPTSLVLAGIIWYNNTSKYCRQYDTSIAMVSSQYGTDGLVFGWYCHSIHSGNFQKTFDSQS
jgi:hypothetical protein